MHDRSFHRYEKMHWLEADSSIFHLCICTHLKYESTISPCLLSIAIKFSCIKDIRLKNKCNKLEKSDLQNAGPRPWDKTHAYKMEAPHLLYFLLKILVQKIFLNYYLSTPNNLYITTYAKQINEIGEISISDLKYI